MSENNTREDYLDELLHAVSRDKTKEELELQSLRSQLKKLRDADEDVLHTSSYSEDEFLREFEKELNEEDYRDFLNELEDEMAETGGFPDVDDADEIPRMAGAGDLPELDGIGGLSDFEEAGIFSGEDAGAQTAEAAASSGIGLREDTPLGGEGSAGISEEDRNALDKLINEINNEEISDVAEGNMPEEMGLQEPVFQEPDLSKTEDGELDLSGNVDASLMDILGDAEGFGDISDLLSGDADLGESDEIGNFAEAEMGQETDADAESGKGKGKKKGFFAKIAKLLFGEEEERIPAASASDGNEEIPLTEENRKIIEELEASEPPKEKKSKKKKEKKPKKEKPKKEKKPKAPKPKKEKPKKEKPVDNTPPLPKVPVLLIFIMAFSMFALVMLGTNLNSYTMQMNQAKELFGKGDYANAFASINGSEIKKADEQLYNQLMVLSSVEGEYNNYTVFLKNGKMDMALDSIICAAGRIEMNQENATEWECTEELDKQKEKIAKELSDQFGMSYDEAIGIYDSKSREIYSQAILEKLQELGLK